MAKMMQYPAHLFHKHRRESAQIPDLATHKKMEPKWIQDYDVHKMRGEIEWLPANEVPWKDELEGLEKKAIAAREVRAAEAKENEEKVKIDAKRKELMAKYEAKKKLELEKATLAQMAKELGEEIPEYLAPAPVSKPEELEPKKVDDESDLKPKKKVFGKVKVDDGA